MSSCFCVEDFSTIDFQVWIFHRLRPSRAAELNTPDRGRCKGAGNRHGFFFGMPNADELPFSRVKIGVAVSARALHHANVDVAQRPATYWLSFNMSRRAMRISGSLKTKFMILLSLLQYYIY